MKTADDIAFDCLVHRYRDPLGAAAYHLCGNRDAAQDIVKETLVDAYKGLANLRDPGNARAWLYTILRRKATAYRLVRNAETELREEPTAPGPEDGEALVRSIVMERMGNLTTEDREILAGKYLLGLSYQEIAGSLGITENAVGVRCFRAMERLREALREVGMDVPGKRS
jgi:RNA polymerase sigma-70 factor (ECF subfamily)